MSESYVYPFDQKLSHKKNQWRLLTPPEREVAYLKQTHNLSDLLSRLLVQRRVSQVDNYLSPTLRALMPDPFQLKDMPMAVRRTLLAIEQKEKIVIFGDYDVDGATSSALLKRFLGALGADMSIYIPDRLAEGYGVNQPALAHLKKQGYGLVVTVDNGTTAFEPLKWAFENELDVIVLDHHMSEETLPKTTALINPNRGDETFGHTYLCAAGVAFLFVVALRQKLKGTDLESKLPDIRSYLDLVALGTVCDVVPLKGLNRAFVTQGLKVLHKQNNPGLRALMRVAGIDEKASAYHLGFILGPRINAGSRIGQADLGATLLSEDDPSVVGRIAEELNGLNAERQAIEAQMLEEAIEQVDSQELYTRSVITVSSSSWHVGVIGIVAGRLKEKYNKPCFVIAIDEQGIGKGSGRSITGVDLGSLAHEARHQGILMNGGGHAMAAGVTIKASHVDAFKGFLEERISMIEESFLDIHGLLTISSASVDLAESLECLSPFGPSNPTPQFLLSNVRIMFASVVGKDHIRCTLQSEDQKRLQAIAFRALGSEMGSRLLSKEREKLCHVVGTVKVDFWQGRRSLKFTITDVMDA